MTYTNQYVDLSNPNEFSVYDTKYLDDFAAPCNGGYRRWAVKIAGKTSTVSRIIWELFNGKIPEGMQIDREDGNAYNDK
jgi:hypothetical protein